MTNIEREVIATRIRLILKYLSRLKRFEAVTLDDYLNDFDKQLIAERLLQLMVEAATDINTYLLVRLYQAPSQTYVESFIEAGRNGIITSELAGQIAQSGGLRNILVHRYKEIDSAIVFAAIGVTLQQYPLYVRQINLYLDSLEVEDG